MTPALSESLARAGFGSLLEARRSAARLVRKQRSGRKGIPAPVVATMYQDYLRLRSLNQCGALYGRSRQSMFCIFKSHQLPLLSRNFHARIVYKGKAYTPGKNGYYRGTVDRRPLHHVMWMDQTGRAIPAGWQVSFKDGDNTNFSRGNLVCAPIAEISRMHYERLYPARARLSATERREFWKDHYRKFAAARAAKFKARGLRSDGKPFRRGKVLRPEHGNSAWRALSDKPGSWSRMGRSKITGAAYL